MLDIAAYAIYLLILACSAVIDWRTLHIPNKLVIAIILDWLVWQILRDILVRFIENGEQADLVFALGAADASAANGVLAAVVLGAGLTLFAWAYEAATHTYSMGGGDIKLMAASALFLGLQRSLLALLIACVVAVLAVLATRAHSYVPTARAHSHVPGRAVEALSPVPASAAPELAPTVPELSTAAPAQEPAEATPAPVSASPDQADALAPRGIPFGPAIAIGSVAALFL